MHLAPCTLYAPHDEPSRAKQHLEPVRVVCGGVQAAPRAAIRLVVRLVLICHFQIFGLACGSARVVCGGKINSTSRACGQFCIHSYYGSENYVKQVISTIFQECIKSFYRLFVQCNSVKISLSYNCK